MNFVSHLILWQIALLVALMATCCSSSPIRPSDTARQLSKDSRCHVNQVFHGETCWDCSHVCAPEQSEDFGEACLMGRTYNFCPPEAPPPTTTMNLPLSSVVTESPVSPTVIGISVTLAVIALGIALSVLAWLCWDKLRTKPPDSGGDPSERESLTPHQNESLNSLSGGNQTSSNRSTRSLSSQETGLHSGPSSTAAQNSHPPPNLNSGPSSTAAPNSHPPPNLNSGPSSTAAPNSQLASDTVPENEQVVTVAIEDSTHPNAQDMVGAGGELCVHCRRARSAVTIFPCRHLSFCAECVDQLAVHSLPGYLCEVCRQGIVIVA